MRHFFLTALFALAAPPIAAGAMTVTDIPSEAAKSDKQLWRLAMTALYGKYDKAQKCWIGKSGGKRYCMRPHTLHKVSVDSSTHYFLAVGGHVMGESNDCHACTGTLGLFVLRDAGKTLGILARNSGYEDYGSWGQVPPEEGFEVHRIGSPDTYAWVIESGWSGQGITVSSYSLHGMIGDQVKDLGWVPASFSDAGNCEDGINMMTQEKCTEVSFDPVYDVDGGKRFADIVARGSGTWKGQPFGQSYRVTFDDQAMTYRIPSDFPDDFRP